MSDRLRKAFERITGWMEENDAPLLAENLADGASKAELDAAEKSLGFALPEELRALWSLHHGQREEMNGFVESLDLFDVRRAIGERETVELFVASLRESDEDWKVAGVTAQEAKSTHWLPFAGRDSELLVVSGVSGRVFSCGKDAPPLRRLAGSITEWLETYADRVENDDFTVEEGFGDYYLMQRDRAAEQRELDDQKRRDAAAKYRRETPLLEQLKAALAKADASTCRDVLEAASAEQLPTVVELVLAGNPEPAFVATALQFVLQKVTLTPQQWAIVEKGAKQLGNNAIQGLAAARAR